MQKLTDKQAMFVTEYPKDFNGSQAAIRSGYSENSARQIATEMLSKVYIQQALAIEMKERTDANGITVEKVLKDIDEIKGLAKKEKEYSNALKANELLGKYLSMWTENVNNNVKITGVQIVDDIDES